MVTPSPEVNEFATVTMDESLTNQVDAPIKFDNETEQTSDK